MEQKKKKKTAMAAYREYVSIVQRLASENGSAASWNQRADAALNGQASAEMRRVISLKTRRRFGAFFTGSKLAAEFIAHFSNLKSNAVIHDPSVGGGDLLLAAASKLPVQSTLDKTLLQWGKQLTGSDLHPEFVRIAKARLILLARQRLGANPVTANSIATYFPGIRVANGLIEMASYKRASHLFLNPPFGVVHAPKNCNWAGGRVTAAAMFVANALEQARPGTELMAILPDVPRSGSFTMRWRRHIEKLAEIKLVQPYGVFDESADVDVFLLHAVRRETSRSLEPYFWTNCPSEQMTSIKDFFHVHVGRVVPHRDPEVGEEHPYIHPLGIPTWKIIRRFNETRRHKGKVYKPPFVVIRRTSRPGHPYRAAATIIAGKKPVAVENHLIVCEPKDGTFIACQNLMDQLMTKSVNTFLDARIRCRHLTVSAVAAIPFKSMA